jgi:transcriptional antiterminator Rof (Rho-off)
MTAEVQKYPLAVHKYTLAQVEALELVPGTVHTNLEGWVPPLATEAELRQALEKAFDYRGDVTLTLKSGERVEAFVFNRHSADTLAESYVQYFAPDAPEKRRLSYDQIARLEFTGKDRAAGKQWEDWVKKYAERKAAGEQGIALHPEALD